MKTLRLLVVALALFAVAGLVFAAGPWPYQRLPPGRG